MNRQLCSQIAGAQVLVLLLSVPAHARFLHDWS